MSKHVRIKMGQDPTENKIVVVADDGTETDITGAVSAVEVSGRPFNVQALITLPWASGEFLASSAHVPISTAHALQALGWTPPPDQPTLYETEEPASTEPGCQHPDCVLDHPHAGPAELARREHP